MAKLTSKQRFALKQGKQQIKMAKIDSRNKMNRTSSAIREVGNAATKVLATVGASKVEVARQASRNRGVTDAAIEQAIKDYNAAISGNPSDGQEGSKQQGSTTTTGGGSIY